MENFDDYLISDVEKDAEGNFANVVDGLFAIARALDGLSLAIHRLGTADAGTRMGAIEVLSMEIKDGFTRLADAISESHE